MKEKVKLALTWLEDWSADLDKAAKAISIVVTAGQALLDLLK